MYDRLQESINANDGRLTTSSSFQLDDEQEQQSDLAAEIRCRLGFEKFLIPIVREQIRQAFVNRKRNILIRALLRIGFVSIDHEGNVLWPLYIAPLHTWRYRVAHEPWFGMFRNLPHVVKWLEGRWLPRRWGGYFIFLEFGDRGSSCLKADLTRRSLCRRGA